MEQYIDQFSSDPAGFISDYPFVLVAFIILAAIAIIGQITLYSKAGQPGIACIVPVWNIIAFLAIVGRPWWHMFLFLIPGYQFYIAAKVYIEVAQSFGKTRTIDYVLILLFNGFYVLNLGLSQKVDYVGPAYKGGHRK